MVLLLLGEDVRRTVLETLKQGKLNVDMTVCGI